jgi:uncharacterized protein YjbI with pentapeptide repeats
MANQEHLTVLKQGVETWNSWRLANREINPDLSEASLRQADLSGAILSGANLWKIDLSGANLSEVDLSAEANLTFANLRGANLRGANLPWANLSRADLSEADLSEAFLSGARLSGTNLSEANLTGATLIRCTFVETNIDGAILNRCRVYGVSVWAVTGQPAEQKDLVITPDGESEITLDNLKVAQFVYLLLNNPEIRNVIDTITSKVVLILGRFTEERKAVLNALRDELRKRNKLPVLFDFTRSENRDTVETIRTLAGMAQFIIADITDAKSVIGELGAIAPHFPSVPIQPIIHVDDDEYGLFDHIKRLASVLEAYRYRDTNTLLAGLEDDIIIPAERKWNELTGRTPKEV